MSDQQDPNTGGNDIPPPPPPGGAVPPPPAPPAGSPYAPPAGGAITPPPPGAGGGFPPPPGGSGGFPPPPASGPSPYTPPPPPAPAPGSYTPPPGDYQVYQPGGMATTGGVADISSAFSWTISAFQKNLAGFLALSGVIAAVSLVGGLISAALISNSAELTYDESGSVVNASGFWGIVGGVVLAIVVAIATGLLRMGLLRAALKRTRGEAPSFAHLTSTENLVPYVLTALVAGILTAIGTLLCIIPGLVIGFLLVFSTVRSLDIGDRVADAMAFSSNAAKANIAPVLVIIVVAFIATFITAIITAVADGVAGGVAGAIVSAIIGLFAEPITALLTANVYRQVTGEAVVD
ncbi:MAG TPA: hypothetical protein PKA24_18715 [Microthrixaceae bacterium]|nr:hypothetical protein [Microthrixaceae bacterium]HMT62900.1 hypothetical protein [Microthrixaceae bacterium]